MDKPDRNGEPSMDEILASIRKIIADDPGSGRMGGDELGVNPLIEAAKSDTSSLQKLANADEPLLPAVDRLTQALQSVPEEPMVTKGFDDDLNDLLEEGPAGGDVSAGQQTNGASPLADVTLASDTEGSQSKATQTSDVPSATSRGLDGSANSESTTQQNGAPAALQPSPAKKPKAVPSFANAFPSTPVPEADASEAVSGDAAPLKSPPSAFIPITRKEAAHQEMALSAPSELESDASAAVEGATSRSPTPFPFDVPTGAAQHSASLEDSPSPTGGGPTADTESAAHTALGALAAGLAATSSSTGGSGASATDPLSGSGVLAPGELQAKQRTLEDVVADMLRPMIEKWVAENMPRIMEKALRGEVAVMKSSHNPTGFRRG